jgi:hypothetical protein
MSKKILGMVELYKLAIGERGNMRISCPLVVEMVEYIGEMEDAIIDYRAALNNCTSDIESVIVKHEDL